MLHRDNPTAWNCFSCQRCGALCTQFLLLGRETGEICNSPSSQGDVAAAEQSPRVTEVCLCWQFLVKSTDAKHPLPLPVLSVSTRFVSL